MTTEKQIQSNRENAKLGGVKTEEGKAVSKYNALKHGIFRETISEYEKDLEEHLAERLDDELKPRGVIEKMLLDRIAVYYLKLFRVAKAEREYMRAKLNPRVEETKDLLAPTDYIKTIVKNEGYIPQIGANVVKDLLDVYARYEATIENRLYKALHELQRIQAARMGEKPPLPVAVDVDVTKD